MLSPAEGVQCYLRRTIGPDADQALVALSLGHRCELRTALNSFPATSNLLSDIGPTSLHDDDHRSASLIGIEDPDEASLSGPL